MLTKRFYSTVGVATLGLLLATPLVIFAAELNNPLGTVDIRDVIGRIIQVVLSVTGSLALLMFIWGGFLWLTSGGAPEKVKKGKETLKWAALGIIVIVLAYTMVEFVINAIASGTVE